MTFANPDAAEVFYPFYSWVLGSSVGVLLIALFSDCIFKNRIVFTPLLFFIALQFLMQAGLLITQLVHPDFETYNVFILFFQGLLESSLQFYMYFLTPIQIATENRVT